MTHTRTPPGAMCSRCNVAKKTRGVRKSKMATSPRPISFGRGRAKRLSTAINRPGKEPSSITDTTAPSSTTKKAENDISKAGKNPSTIESQALLNTTATVDKKEDTLRSTINPKNPHSTTMNSPATRNRAAKNESDLTEFLLRCFTNPESDNLKKLLIKVENFIKSFEVQIDGIKKVVDLLTEAAIEDRDLAIGVGQTVDTLVDFEMMGNEFRSLFLKKIQELYKQRQEMKFNNFLGLTSMICSVFNYVRVNDQPMKALAMPVYFLLNEVLDGKSNGQDEREQEIETFHETLLIVASSLEECDKEKMVNLFNKVRQTILKKASPKMRCLLMECLEYYASGQWTIDNETKLFYTDLFSGML